MWYWYISQLYSSIFDIMLWRDNTCEFALNCYRRLWAFSRAASKREPASIEIPKLYHLLSDPRLLTFKERGQKKTGLCGKNSQVADPLTPSPQFGNFHIFLPFFCHFISPWIGKNREKYGVGLGQTAPPQFGNFSHIIPFFSDNDPYWFEWSWQ